MIYKILSNDPTLHEQPADKFDFNNPPLDPIELFENLKETMIANLGVGLSAPQVGIPYQAFVIGDPHQADSVFSVFNPLIVNSTGYVLMQESCLTFPGLFIKMKRPHKIRVRFSGHDGKVGTMPMEGLTARIFQNQFDHLHGMTFDKRASHFQLERAKKQKRKLDRIAKGTAKNMPLQFHKYRV